MFNPEILPPSEENTKEYEEAIQNLREKEAQWGQLARTFEDHALMGSTPPEGLQNNINPGFSEADIMTDHEIKEHLDYLVSLANLANPQGGLVGMQKEALSLVEPTINYLKKIDRLPGSYENKTAEELIQTPTEEAPEPSTEELRRRYRGVSRLIHWITNLSK